MPVATKVVTQVDTTFFGYLQERTDPKYYFLMH